MSTSFSITCEYNNQILYLYDKKYAQGKEAENTTELSL